MRKEIKEIIVYVMAINSKGGKLHLDLTPTHLAIYDVGNECKQVLQFSNGRNYLYFTEFWKDEFEEDLLKAIGQLVRIYESML